MLTAPCPLSRLKGKYRWHLLLKCPDGDALRTYLRRGLLSLTASDKSGMTIDLDPMSLL